MWLKQETVQRLYLSYPHFSRFPHSWQQTMFMVTCSSGCCFSFFGWLRCEASIEKLPSTDVITLVWQSVLACTCGRTCTHCISMPLATKPKCRSQEYLQLFHWSSSLKCGSLASSIVARVLFVWVLCCCILLISGSAKMVFSDYRKQRIL